MTAFVQYWDVLKDWIVTTFHFLLYLYPVAAISILAVSILAVYSCYARRKCILSKNTVSKAIGQGLGTKRLLGFFAITAIFFWICSNGAHKDGTTFGLNNNLVLYLLSWIFLGLIGGMVRKILRSSILDNKQKDRLNSWLQASILLIVTILVFVGVWELISQCKEYGAIIAAVLGWIFQDYIKGVISYLHLRQAGLLHFGDWIIVKKYEISGMVIDCTLLTVTVRNWDNTISSIAMYSLQAESFQNNQEMLDGKTSGRRMKRDFMIDTSTVHVVAKEEKQQIENSLRIMGEDTIALQNAKPNILNISLFRLYLRHWLMNHDDICRFPRLIVALKEPLPEGIPMEVYVFILKTRLAQFELVQSEIEEHILLTMQLFGLRLFQRLSAYDVPKTNMQTIEAIKEEDHG